MDNAVILDEEVVDVNPEEVTLSYDEIAYEDQVPVAETSGPSLADRISQAKLYLLPESSAARAGKRKRNDDEATADIEDEDMTEDTARRNNAVLLTGSPISHLPTARIFAYATHFDAHPMGLEWVDDTTCVLVFESPADARIAANLLHKTTDEANDEEGFVHAKSIPMTFWPPEERISASLGKGEGLKGTIRMRWATHGDVKKRGARKESEFYRKHGLDAGRESERPRTSLLDTLDDGATQPKRRRRDDDHDASAYVKAQLDDEIDEFLREDPETEEAPPSPPSKMRSDHMGTDGRTLLERTSAIRAHPEESLATRITAALPRRARRSDREERWSKEPSDEPRPRRRERGGRRRQGKEGERERRTEPRPRKTQEELDAELDAFLNDRS
ncbi:hypothetical protein EVG20_g9236 [Dentipellis fragilis]|uniref:Chromatin target of PRMT1 protein C-terminal domain-containing protein n=1 Tax=Dentipellis fragilis TaxID=205917 RepID=A0A4Y9XZY5_9AGAM|nr:hypothetical protein EVG20_g9236 [Dentipellis fragilis]